MTHTDPIENLLTHSEIDNAVATLQKLATARQAELSTAGRVDTAGSLVTNNPLFEAIEQLQTARQYRAIPDELMLSWRKIRQLDAEEQ